MNKAFEGSRQPARIEALDSARGWAILSVIAIHVSQAAQLPPGILHSLAINGDMGVELFYVLSAFSLTMVLQARTAAGNLGLAGYFIRRFFRIAPMFWAALLLSVMLFWGKQSFWSPDGIGWLSVLLTAIFLHGVHPESINAVIPGGWSVAVEVMFYLTLPVLFKFTSSSISALRWLLVSLGIYYLFGFAAQAYFDQALSLNAKYLSEIYSWYMSFPAQLPVFVMGIWAFWIVKDGNLKPVYAYTIFFAGLALLLCNPITPENHLLPRHLLWGGVFTMFVVANVQRPIFLFDNALMKLLGRISYSVYLLHFIVLIYIGKIFRHSTIPAEIKFALLIFVTVGISYFFASWTYRVIELPNMRRGGELSRRFDDDLVGSKKESHGK